VAKGGSGQTDRLPDHLSYQGLTREETGLCSTPVAPGDGEPSAARWTPGAAVLGAPAHAL